MWRREHGWENVGVNNRSERVYESGKGKICGCGSRRECKGDSGVGEQVEVKAIGIERDLE